MATASPVLLCCPAREGEEEGGEMSQLVSWRESGVSKTQVDQ